MGEGDAFLLYIFDNNFENIISKMKRKVFLSLTLQEQSQDMPHDIQREKYFFFKESIYLLNIFAKYICDCLIFGKYMV